MSNFTKTLQKLEAEEKEYYGKLKTLFKPKSSMREKLDKLNAELDQNQDSSSVFSEQKNELSVEKAKLESRISGLKEELAQINNAESLSHLKSLNAANTRISELKQNLENMGNVNMKALEIYEGLKKEYDKLGWRVSKLRSEKDETMKVIDEIEKKKKDSFMDTFDEMARHFKEIYSKMTEKNHQAIVALEDYKNPFNGGVFVRLKQDNKYMNIASLSGGEKVIVALALIFAIQEFKPAPFYLLDEIDAALDNVNSQKVADLLKEYSKKAQIIMISHNDAIISAADYLYGVSMNKAGESKITSLEL